MRFISGCLRLANIAVLHILKYWSLLSWHLRVNPLREAILWPKLQSLCFSALEEGQFNPTDRYWVFTLCQALNTELWGHHWSKAEAGSIFCIFAPFWEFAKFAKPYSTSPFIHWAHPCARLPTGDKMVNRCPYLHRAGSLVEGTDTWMGNYEKRTRRKDLVHSRSYGRLQLH